MEGGFRILWRSWLPVKVKVSDFLVVPSSVEHVAVGYDLPFIQAPADNRQNCRRLSSCVALGLGKGTGGALLCRGAQCKCLKVNVKVRQVQVQFWKGWTRFNRLIAFVKEHESGISHQVQLLSFFYITFKFNDRKTICWQPFSPSNLYWSTSYQKAT